VATSAHPTPVTPRRPRHGRTPRPDCGVTVRFVVCRRTQHQRWFTWQLASLLDLARQHETASGVHHGCDGCELRTDARAHHGLRKSFVAIHKCAKSDTQYQYSCAAPNRNPRLLVAALQQGEPLLRLDQLWLVQGRWRSLRHCRCERKTRKGKFQPLPLCWLCVVCFVFMMSTVTQHRGHILKISKKLP
jgi:hypothetical protein